MPGSSWPRRRGCMRQLGLRWSYNRPRWRVASHRRGKSPRVPPRWPSPPPSRQFRSRRASPISRGYVRSPRCCRAPPRPSVRLQARASIDRAISRASVTLRTMGVSRIRSCARWCAMMAAMVTPSSATRSRCMDMPTLQQCSRARRSPRSCRRASPIRRGSSHNGRVCSHSAPARIYAASTWKTMASHTATRLCFSPTRT
mmetsp:Transcript_21338/g.64968  ORF Transcript_21338/g.64968 Transcript_21338/m.64968 type:complete len:200 (-) Transcript_21338:1241-1840(-)